jgi:trans-aconitate methyltransferase
VNDLTETSSKEWDAQSYHRLSQPQVAWGERVLARLELQGGETVIDAGCGTGRLTAALLERLPRGHVIALDASSQMLEKARETLKARFGDRVSFLHVDLLALDLEQVADVIFSTATFHWVLDHPCLFRNLYRALKPGGRLVAQCGGGPNLARTLQRAELVMEDQPYAPFFAGWPGTWEFADAAVTAERLRAAGFAHVETGLEPATTVLQDAEEYRQFVSTVIFRPHLERLPDDLKPCFLDTLVARAEQDTPPLSLDYWRLNLQASRPPDDR